MSDERLTLTIAEAAEALGLSVRSVYRAAGTGELPAIRVGRRILIPRDRFEAFMAGRPDELLGLELDATPTVDQITGRTDAQ